MKRQGFICSALIIGSVSLLTGCTFQRDVQMPLHPWQREPERDLDKEALLERLIQMEKRITGLKSIQIVRLLNQKNGQIIDAQSLVALKRPDQYRLKLFSSLGLTLIEFVLSRDGFRFRMPSKGIDFIGKKEEAREKIPYFPVEALREAFVHSFEADRIDWHQLEQKHLLILHKKGEISMIKRWIDQKNLTLLKEVFLREEAEELIIDYRDYRPHAEGKGLFLPYRIAIRLPQEGLRLEIKVIQYEVNPAFHEKMFDLSGWGPRIFTALMQSPTRHSC